MNFKISFLKSHSIWMIFFIAGLIIGSPILVRSATDTYWTGGTGTGVIYYNGGNVGIGVNNPITKLEVRSNGDDHQLLLTDYTGGEYTKMGYSNDKNFFSILFNVGLPVRAHEFRMNYGDPAFTFTTDLVQNAVNILRNGNVGIGTTTPTQKLEVNGRIKGDIIPSNRNTVGLDHNILFNAANRYTVTQSGPATFDLNALFDGALTANYPLEGPTLANPQVIVIEDLPNVHTQVGAWVGWTARYWAPKKFKIEGYKYSTNSWITLSDYSTVNYTSSEFMVNLSSNASSYTKLKFTIYEGSGSNSGIPRVGLSEIYFIHPEALRPYSGLLPSNLFEAKNNVGIGTSSPTQKLEVVGNIKLTGTGSSLISDGDICIGRCN